MHRPGGGCSSAAVNGRFLTFIGSQTISNPPNNTPTLADLRAFTTADRFNFAPFNYILTPSERYGGWVSVKQELTDNINLRVKALVQPPQFGEPGGVRTAVHRP